jgi:hypothetical protein
MAKKLMLALAQHHRSEKESVCYPQPKTFSERVAIANDFVKRFGYRVPLVVDGIEPSSKLSRNSLRRRQR